jgi:hypothetical protein
LISDGSVTFTGNWAGYLAYIHHKTVYPRLAAYNLGSSDETSRYHLMVDLITREAFIAICSDSEKIMEENWRLKADQIENMELTGEQMEILIKAFEEGLQQTPSNDALARSMEHEHQAVMELTRWLDQNGRNVLVVFTPVR